MSRWQALRLGEQLLEATRRGLATSSRSTGGRRPRPARGGAPPPAAVAAAAPAAPPPVPASQAGAQEWTQVVHQQTGLTYFWNERTGETTALGEPQPGPEGRLASVRPTAPQQARAVAGGLGQLVAMGAGVGLVFALISRVF